jgi:hypothetical protein
MWIVRRMTFTPRELPYAWDDVKTRLQRDIQRLLERLSLDVRPDPQGRVWPLNPRRADRRPGSFNIATRPLKGMDIGGWKDFATDQKGDVFDLIAFVEGLQGKMDVYWWALDFLGLGKGEVRTKGQAELDRERLRLERIAAEKKAIEDAEAKSQRLYGHWLGLQPLVGSLAEVYLREGRGIDLSRLKRLPGAIRFAPAADHIDDDGVVTTWPCMVTAATRGSKLTGLHRTWLQLDGLAKAPVTPAKKMSGSLRGAAMRLSSGPSGLSPTEAAKRGRADPLLIGEGIETTLTGAVARPDYRAWAAGSLSLMGLLEWPECASAAILLQDADWKPEAVKAFEKVKEHWEAQAKGRPLKVVRA